MSSTAKLGVICGGTDLPVLAIESAIKEGCEPVVIAIDGEADNRIDALSDKVYWLKVGKLAQAIDIFLKNGVSRSIMVGRVPHRKMFGEVDFDEKLHEIYVGLKDRKADSILEATVKLFEKAGIKFIDSTTYLRDFMAPEGQLGKVAPIEETMRDVAFGWKLAKKIAGLDIGQAVVVKDRAVIAIEAMEGTDEMVKRSGNLCPSGVAVVKVAKPQQDFRFDVPVVGPDTLRNMVGVKASALAVESEKTLLIGREEMIEIANKNGISILGVKDQDIEDTV